MPLLDHFHEPLRGARHWESFHARWAAAIADNLNRDVLPDEYVAEIQISLGGQVEVDVATMKENGDQGGSSAARDSSPRDAATATLSPRLWTPPEATWSVSLVFPTSIGVRIINLEAGPTLVAAIELVSPGNKDRLESRRAIAIKCASYLHEGIGLVVVDVVTNGRANLHNELIDLLQLDPSFHFDHALQAVAYRPLYRNDTAQMDIWPRQLAVGEILPELPLGLRNAACVPVDLEAAYEETRRVTRLGG